MKHTNYLIYLNILFILLCSSCTEPLPQKIQNRQIKQIGQEGSLPGQFREPRGLSITPSGHLLVTDFRNYRIQELTLQGHFLNQWGTKGNQPGQFNDPTIAVINNIGELFVVDSWNHRIQKLDSAGNWNADWAKDDGFYAPRGITIDEKNHVYISNTSYHQIKLYDSQGNYLSTWGTVTASDETFHDPVGLAFDKKTNLIYVADTGNQRIKVLSLNGETVRLISVPDWEKDKFHEAYIAIGDDGKIYTTVPHKNLILVFTPDGRLYSRFGESGGGPEQLNYPTGIAVDSSNNIYISDTLNHRIVVYAPAPPLPTRQERPPSALTELFSIFRYCIDFFALIILLKWFLDKRKTKPVKTTSLRISFITPYQNWCQSHKILMTSGWLIITIIHFSAIHYFSTAQTTLAYRLLLITMFFWFFLELSRNYSYVISSKDQKIQRHVTLILLVLILGIGLWFRTYKLSEIPWGTNNDAAWNGMYAMRILDGEPYTPFTSEAWGKSTLYFYIIAFIFKLFGEGRFTLLVPCISFGLLSVILIYFLTRYLLNNKIALISSFIYATLAWNIVFSRTGYRVILSPALFLMTFLFFFKAIDTQQWKRKLLFFLLSGISVGIGQHTYFSFRGIPLMMVIIGIHSWITEQHFIRRNWWGFIALLLAFFIAFSPLAIYAIHNWDAFMGRSDFLFIGNKIKTSGSLAPLWKNIKINLLIYHYKARVGNFFNNDWPIVTRPVVFFSLLGFLFFIRHIRKRAGFFFITSFIFGLLPGILSEADAARLFLTTIPLATFCAVGMKSFFNIPFKHSQRIETTFLIASSLLIGLAEYNFYFNKLGNDYYAQFGYARKHTLIGLKARELSSDYEVYVSQGHFIDTPKFICYRIPWNVFKITNGEVIDVVPVPQLLKNLKEIFDTERIPGKKGLAFVLENDPKNTYVLNEIRKRYPKGEFQKISDSHYPEPIFYIYVIPNRQLAHDNESTK